ncbi:MAG: hypothetical protein ACJ8CB_04055 [Ktedonobacteraceae bacterium]
MLNVLDDVRKRVFSDDDVRLLNLLAPQAAIALRKAVRTSVLIFNLAIPIRIAC